MKLIKILIILTMLFSCKVSANNININVNNYDELMQSANETIDGDTITLINNLVSDNSIGNSFYTKDLTFLGQNYSIDGLNIYGGFVLSTGSNFDSLKILNFKGQSYNNSYFAGAIYNTSGTTNISNSAFVGNYADSQGINFAVAGALYNMNNGTVSIDSSLFSNNYTNGASAEGGAIGNEAGANTISISDSVFNNNYTFGSTVSYGGAIYNGNDANIDIKNTLFNNNYASTNSTGVFLYGGSIFNTGNMNIENCYFNNNHILGNSSSFAYGGAIHNNSNLKIINSTFKNNYIASDIDATGGAIYNYYNGVMTVENSLFENNFLIAQNNRGGAIGNEGTLTINNSTFKNNMDSSGENDISTVGTLNFNGSGTTNILSGIRGSGHLYKNDDGVLNLGGNNSNYTGCFCFNQGTVNLLANSTYFNAKMTDFSNNVNFNIQNNQINDINFGILTLNGQANIYPDVDFNSETMDTISASQLTGSGDMYIPNLSFIGTPTQNYIAIPFADSILKNSVKYNSRIIQTPIYNYLASYNPVNGYFDFSRQNFNSGILASPIATQIAGYLAQVDMFQDIFSNLDMVLIMDKNKKIALENYNKYSYETNGQFTYSPLSIPEQKNGIWFKPYTTFEKIPLRGGPDVSNVGYGTIFGGESKLINLKKGWKYLYGGFSGYNGSHQAYDGIGIYNNGGFIGADCAFYKKDFFSLWAISAGANSAKASTNFGNDNFAMLNAGIAQKSGINIPMFENKFILQPSIMTSYTFVNTFDFNTPYNISVNSKPLNAIHVEPQIKLIGNFKDLLQPYLSVSIAWNILDDTRFYANDVYLSELSIKPYVRYGIGIQKRIKDKFSGFFQIYFTNGGRNGVGLQAGFRWALGKDGTKPRIIENKIPEKPKTEIILRNINVNNISASLL